MTAYIYNDGGRADAGFKGTAGDCVTRAIAITTGKPYKEVYDRLAHGNATKTGTKSARNGICTKHKWFQDYMRELGFVWTPTMTIGSGCQVHARQDELPQTDRLILKLSKHYAAWINGTLHDTHDCTRAGTRCVYGYWKYTERNPS